MPENTPSNPPCLFCNRAKSVLENDLAYARFDEHPVSPGHLLIVPKRHVADFFEATWEEQSAILALINLGKAEVLKNHNPDGFNIGVNCGVAAGQSVMHVHVHLIPRYQGDVPNPRGGVRAVIPHKQAYPGQGKYLPADTLSVPPEASEGDPKK